MLDFSLEKKLVFSLNEKEFKAFTNVRHYCEENDLSIFDLEITDGKASYFVVPDFEIESEELLNIFDEINNKLEREIILSILDKIKEIKDFNYIEIKQKIGSPNDLKKYMKN